MFTPFSELDAVLEDFVRAVRDILGDTFVGCYLQGSFALGAGDLDSDCDFIVATASLLGGVTAGLLRGLHNDIPTRPGFWTKHLEGSYADVTSLRGPSGVRVPWLFCDHGQRSLMWDAHCNTLHTRWILRNRGIALSGAPIADIVDEVPPAAMREAARLALPATLDEVRAWAPMDAAWTQRYIVSTYCRVLYTLHTAEVASKRGALEWATESLDRAWCPLLAQVMADRANGWNPREPPRRGSMEATYEFASYAEEFAASG